jgi:hypothetical protein
MAINRDCLPISSELRAHNATDWVLNTRSFSAPGHETFKNIPAALPLMTAAGPAFPEREHIIFLTFV